MRFTEFIGDPNDVIDRRSVKSKYHPCPQCGQAGKRKHVSQRQISHVSALHRRCWILAEVGVYQARCNCSKYFQAPIPGVPHQGSYSYEVRNSVANGLIRDRMPYRLLIERMQEDYLLKLSLGYLHHCFLWAHEQINMKNLGILSCSISQESCALMKFTIAAGRFCLRPIHSITLRSHLP